MTEWFVELLGSQNDLLQLVSLSSPRSWEVRRDGEMYFLLSSDFDAVEESIDVHDMAINQTFPQVLGAVKLLLPNNSFGHLEVGGHVFHYDSAGNRRGNHFILSGPIEMSATATMTANLSGGRAAPKTEKPLNVVIGALRNQSRVGDALPYFGALSEGNWPVELYKVMELITADIGEADLLATNGSRPSPMKAMQRGWSLIASKGWATEQEIDGFRAVHYPVLTGPTARHAVQTRQPPEVPISTQHAATKFVRRVLEAWLRQMMPS